jgi:acyl-CoA synthetase (NDP forming)
MAPPAPAHLDRLLRPRSVAIVGASAAPGALGGSVLANLERAGFRGEVHLVNPKRPVIGGRQCLGAVEELPEGVDVAVLAIPRAAVLPSVQALAGRRVGAIIVFSAGYAEGGEAGRDEQGELARICREHGIVLEGPNCLGLVNHVDGVPLTFIEMTLEKLGPRPGIGIVSQSGAMAAVLGVNLLARGLGVSFSVSTGNEADRGVEDFVEYLADDPHTRVLALIVEQFRRPRRFLAAARRARDAGKRIVLLHPGRSRAARASAATHTGAMAGDFEVMRLKVEQAGVMVAGGLEEFGDVLDLALRCPGPVGGGAAVLTDSGAFKALTLDLGETIGLALPEPAGACSARLRAAMPDFIPVSNPLDLTAQALIDPGIYQRTLAPFLDDPRFGAVVLGIIQTDPTTCRLKVPPILAALRELKPSKPVLFAGLDEGAAVPPEYIRELRELGVPYFPTPERAFRALARTAAWSGPSPATIVAPLLVQGLPSAGGVVPEHRAKAILTQAGIRFPRGRLVARVEDAQAVAADLGFPVVLKAQAVDLPHKSEAGGVIVGLADRAALAAGWARLQANLARHRPGLVLEGVLVEVMGRSGVELIIGARQDPEWGPVILVGFGGVTAEILQDVRLLPPDLPMPAIVAELGRLKQAPRLHGFRGSPALDVAAVAEIVSRLGRLMLTEPRIREIDLNPVVVYPQGEGALALDALILAGKPAESR